MITQAEVDAAERVIQDWRTYLMQIEYRVNTLNAIIENQKELQKQMEQALVLLQAAAQKG